MKKWPAGNTMCFMALYKWRIQPEHLFPAPHPHFFWESSDWKQAEFCFHWGKFSIHQRCWKRKQSCSVVSDSLQPQDCSLPGSSVHGMLKLLPRDWCAWTCHLTFWESQVIWKFMCQGEMFSIILSLEWPCEITGGSPCLWHHMFYVHSPVV